VERRGPNRAGNVARIAPQRMGAASSRPAAPVNQTQGAAASGRAAFASGDRTGTEDDWTEF
jgi:hypothetical protein